jgi:hypothetical protein
LIRIRTRQYHCEEDESRQNRVKNAEFQLHLGKDYFKEFDSELNELMTNQDRVPILNGNAGFWREAQRLWNRRRTLTPSHIVASI